MKKLVSLFVALILAVSLFAVTAVAFAEEETPRTVTYNDSAFWALDDVKSIPRLHANSDSFQLNYGWLKDESKVKSVFSGINYTLKTPTEEEKDVDEYAVADGSDKIYVEYCVPSRDYKEDWSQANVGSNINVTSSGWWAFRYVAKSGTTVLARTSRIDVYFGDENVPIINDLSSDMTKVQADGIKVGNTYTIKTNLSIKDDSSTTVSYVVFKKVNGSWTSEPIYDSKTKEVVEGYEDDISTSGTITMHDYDVLGDKEPVYKITYTVTDSLGYVSNTKDMLIFAVAEEKEALTSTQIWTIVLFSIAILSLIGIVVVIFIKPKEAVAQRVAAPKKDEDANNSEK